MAAPTYTTDLSLLDECNTDTGYVEPTASGWTQLNAESFGETDLFIQGTTCISATCKVGVGGTLYDSGAGGVSIPTDGAYLVWAYWAAPNSLDDETNGGIRTLIGSGTADFNAWKHGGKDTYTYGGWINIATNPTVSADYTEGSPTGTYRYFGWIYNATAVPSKGNPYCVDVMRYGRCSSIFREGDSTNGYATFAGFAAINDDTTNRWGLLQTVGGGYLWKGLMVLGDSTGAVDFRDSNSQVIIDNTKKVTSNFNKIEVDNTASRVDLTNITFQSLSAVSKGKFEMVSNADVNINTCTFVDMDTFVFLSNGTTIDSVFRRCGQITQGGSVFTGCRFDKSPAAKALVVSDLSQISGCTFVSDGTGYAMEGFDSTGSYTLTNITFTGYAGSDGTSGNEAIHVLATGGTVDITVSGGNTPSIHSDGATVNVISGSVNATVTVKTVDGTNIEGARVIVKAETGGPMPYDVTVTIARTDTTATVTHASHGMATNDKVLIKGANQQEYNGVNTITKIDNNTYTYPVTGSPDTPATGTIKATYVALFGTTNSSGVITMSRVFSSSQPISGRVRLSSSPPYYKTSNIIGTIDSGSGFSTTVQLLEDT